MIVEDAVVLITGASEGIGAACAAAFRARGACVCLVARSAEKLNAVARAGELVLPADLLDSGAREAAIARTLDRHGRIDILVNNAGVGLYEPAHRAPLDETRRMFELNFFAPLHLAQLAAVPMKKQGRGTIVNVSSIGGEITLPWFTLYSATKHALGSLTDGLRMELARDNIHCIAVCPGYVKTRFQTNVLSGDVPPALGGMRQRWAITPEQCAAAIVDGVVRNKRTVVTPFSGWALIWLERFAPRLLHSRLTRMYTEQVPEA